MSIFLYIWIIIKFLTHNVYLGELENGEPMTVQNEDGINPNAPSRPNASSHASSSPIARHDGNTEPNAPSTAWENSNVQNLSHISSNTNTQTVSSTNRSAERANDHSRCNFLLILYD